MAKVTHEEAAKQAVRMKIKRLKASIEKLNGELERALAYLGFLEQNEKR
jgi:hypothetical protein